MASWRHPSHLRGEDGAQVPGSGTQPEHFIEDWKYWTRSDTSTGRSELTVTGPPNAAGHVKNCSLAGSSVPGSAAQPGVLAPDELTTWTLSLRTPDF